MEKTFIKSLSVLCVAGCAMLSLAQCSKINEPEEETGPSGKTVTLTIRGEAPDTRTSLGENGAVLWNEGDMIWINDSEYQVIPDPENPYMATVPGVAESDEYHAMYGDVRYYDSYEDYYSIYVSDWQYYHENSFDINRCNPMVAFSKTTDIEFKNVAGILRIGLTGNASTEIKSITVVSNDYFQYMSGELHIPATDIRTGELNDSYACDYECYGSYYIYMSDIYTGLSQEPTYCHFIVPAQTYAEGITLIIEDTDGNVGFKRTENPVDVRRSNLVPMEPFEFEPAPAPEINVVSNEVASLSINVSAEPGVQVYTAILTRHIYDAWPEETREDYIKSIMNRFATVPSDGILNLGTENLGLQILASTDYILAAGYQSPATGEVLGDISITGMTTAAASGTKPEINILEYSIDLNGGHYDENGCKISISSTDAASISVFFYSASFYESLKSQGMSDEEIMASYGNKVGEFGVESANNGLCLYSCFPDILYPGSDYILMVMATGDGGLTALDTENIRIPSHIPVDAQWDIISVNGEMNLELYNIESSYNWNYLIVDKLSGSNIFRVHLPMNQDEYIVQELRNYGLGLESDGTYYLYFTVTPSNSVAILPNESWTGFMYDSEPTYFMSKWNGYADTNGESYYNLSVETVLSYGNDDFMKKDISDGSIWLHFDIADETYERNGLSTESFDNNNEIISW